MLECVNSMSLPSSTAGEEISNCLSSHWQHTHKHTLTQASLQLIQTELLRDSQQLIGTVSVSSFARFSHSGRKEELSKTCNCHSLPKKKTPARYLSLSASALLPLKSSSESFHLPGSEMQSIRRLSLAPFTPCINMRFVSR